MLQRVLILFSFLMCIVVEAKQKDFYTFKVVNSRGKLVSLEKYRGSVSLEAEEKESGALKHENHEAFELEDSCMFIYLFFCTTHLHDSRGINKELTRQTFCSFASIRLPTWQNFCSQVLTSFLRVSHVFIL